MYGIYFLTPFKWIVVILVLSLELCYHQRTLCINFHNMKEVPQFNLSELLTPKLANDWLKIARNLWYNLSCFYSHYILFSNINCYFVIMVRPASRYSKICFCWQFCHPAYILKLWVTFAWYINRNGNIFMSW